MRTENRAYRAQGAENTPKSELGIARDVALQLLEKAGSGSSAAAILGQGDAKKSRGRLLSLVYPKQAGLTKEDEALLTRATIVVVSAYDSVAKPDAKSAAAYKEACRWARDDLGWAKAHVGNAAAAEARAAERAAADAQSAARSAAAEAAAEKKAAAGYPVVAVGRHDGIDPPRAVLWPSTPIRLPALAPVDSTRAWLARHAAETCMGMNELRSPMAVGAAIAAYQEIMELGSREPRSTFSFVC